MSTNAATIDKYIREVFAENDTEDLHVLIDEVMDRLEPIFQKCSDLSGSVEIEGTESFYINKLLVGEFVLVRKMDDGSVEFYNSYVGDTDEIVNGSEIVYTAHSRSNILKMFPSAYDPSWIDTAEMERKGLRPKKIYNN